ncbi:MAG: F0F1 ATP synthase subunit epsilon [Rickettsiales bacterium]
MEEKNISDLSIKVEIITPEDIFTFSDVYMAVMPGSEGEFGVLPGHMSLIATLDFGEISIYDKSMKIIKRVTINAGIADINATSVLILTDQAIIL